jgi:phospholipid/cholesterol/gamma-HCH transport system substrate-binding protein
VATEAHKFQVGVFVIVAIVIGTGAAIWLGASRFFEQTKEFVTYYAESVQGLDPGAAVKYRGVPAGRVDAIRIAPDGVLIEVLMDLDTNVDKALKGDDTLRATLELSGITGLRYIEIDRQAGEALNQAPILTFKPPAELIPSARSSFKALQAAFADVYQRFMQLDLAGISSDARDTLQAAKALLRDQRLATILNNVETTSASTQQLADRLQGLVTRVAPAVDNATAATADAKALFASLNQGVTGRQLGETLDRLDRLAQSTQQFVLGLQSTVDRFDRTVANLQSLTDEVREQPSLLLFSAPPPPRHPAERSGR